MRGRADGDGMVKVKGVDERGAEEDWRTWVRCREARAGRRSDREELKRRRQEGQRSGARLSEAALTQRERGGRRIAEPAALPRSYTRGWRAEREEGEEGAEMRESGEGLRLRCCGQLSSSHSVKCPIQHRDAPNIWSSSSQSYPERGRLHLPSSLSHVSATPYREQLCEAAR